LIAGLLSNACSGSSSSVCDERTCLTTGAYAPVDAEAAGSSNEPDGGSLMVASPIAPEGAIVSAWDDLGLGFGGAEANGDVVVEVIPTPVLRTGAP
jgi:hypothetical protein